MVTPIFFWHLLSLFLIPSLSLIFLIFPANCQKAQLRIYDGYEHSLEDHTVLKKFCGDTRFYKVSSLTFPLYILCSAHIIIVRIPISINQHACHFYFVFCWLAGHKHFYLVESPPKIIVGMARIERKELSLLTYF